ncbi:MAG: sporulation-delaying protein SdpB family protein [Acidobacteriota bacterium]
MNKIPRLAADWSERIDPWTNVYGVARTVIASATLLTLLFNPASTLFRPASGVATCPNCFGMGEIGLFCLFGRSHLELARWLAVAILAVVASGWRPRVTGLPHWWIAFSLQSSAMTIDGGDQVAAVLTLLMLPLTLTDDRRWHWVARSPRANPAREAVMRVIALSALLAIRIQVAGIYLHAAVGKMKVPEWVDGTVLYYWFTDPTFGAPPWLRSILLPLLQNGITVSLMTWGSMVLELFLFAALVMPKRAWRPFLIAGVAFHGGIALIQGLFSFSLTMAGALILYLRPIQEEFGARKFPLPLPRRQSAESDEQATIERAMAY